MAMWFTGTAQWDTAALHTQYKRVAPLPVMLPGESPRCSPMSSVRHPLMRGCVPRSWLPVGRDRHGFPTAWHREDNGSGYKLVATDNHSPSLITNAVVTGSVPMVVAVLIAMYEYTRNETHHLPRRASQPAENAGRTCCPSWP